MVVQKYGGTSVATIEKIEKVARFIKARLQSEKKIIVVVSAMSGETDNLILLSEKFSNSSPPNKREADQLVCLGENKSIALLALALNNLGVKAISLTGWQAGIITNDCFGYAHINTIQTEKIKQKLRKFDVVVVAGFQGVTQGGDVTTLGKGGSDTTAVALASVFGCKCEIYTDVCGVFSADPKLLPSAKKIDELTYDELMEMSANGAKVMETRSVEIAKKFGVDLWIGESLKDIKNGTCVMKENKKILENMTIKNITAKDYIVVLDFKFESYEKLNLFLGELKKFSNQKLEIFELKNFDNDKYFISLCVDKNNCESIKNKFENSIIKKYEVGTKITLTGSGLRTHSELFQKMMFSLKEISVQPQKLALNEVSISFVVDESEKQKTITKLAKVFDLESKENKKKINLALVGATGLVGKTFLQVLTERNFANKIENLFLFASENSAGQRIEFVGKKIEIKKLDEQNIKNKKIDFAFFAVDENISKQFAPIFVKYGIIVIDNSSAFRLEKEIPLIVSEVNFEHIFSPKIIANPNCSTIQVMLPLNVLKNKFGLKRVDFVTFQAVSGSGNAGLEDLERTTKGDKPKFYPYPIFNNCIPQIGSFKDNGFSSEELKMVNETHKILGDDDIEISATCVRVPVKNCHCVEVVAHLKSEVEIDEIKNAFAVAENIEVVDDVEKNGYPINQTACGQDKVFVGRIRQDLYQKNVVHFWCVADNIRKGAATNGVQILEKLLEK